jgi:hypothetical protein
MTERTATWVQRLLIPFLLAFLVGGIALNERVGEIKATQVRVLGEKADKAYVDAKFDAIMAQILVTQNMIRDHTAQTARPR